tara:strand:- start:339 stop:782 length:444 start_codon:yes stop_codon:yes gene_type:complete
MAHFAKLDSDNLVTQVIVVSDSDTSTDAGVEAESIGVAFCQKLTGIDTIWKQTSYNANGNGFRGNYAGIGCTYMTDVETLGVAKTDIFISQQPYPSWVIGIQTAQWYPPTPPGDAPALTPAEEAANKYYIWNESNYNSNPSTAWVLT